MPLGLLGESAGRGDNEAASTSFVGEVGEGAWGEEGDCAAEGDDGEEGDAGDKAR